MRDVFTTGFFIDLNKVALSTNPSESYLSGSVRDIGELESLCYRLCDEKDPIKRASDILYTTLAGILSTKETKEPALSLVN